MWAEWRTMLNWRVQTPLNDDCYFLTFRASTSLVIHWAGPFAALGTMQEGREEGE